MKKRLFFPVLLFALLWASLAAAEAPDISLNVNFSAGSNTKWLHRLTDRDYGSSWAGNRGHGTLELESHQAMHGLYIAWEQAPQAFSIEVFSGQTLQETIQVEASDYIHQFYPLNGYHHIRLVPQKDNGKHFSIKEMFVFSQGSLPSWVQQWEPTHSDADMMLLFAHPDDEVLFFGGLLPYYGAERGLKVLPVVLTYATPMRQSELLNSLWSLGIRNYPVIGPFSDRYAWRLEEAYKLFNKRKANAFITEIIRKYKPEVIVSHDVGGEYGHGAHRLCADLVKNGIHFASDPSRYTDSYKAYGAFDVQKVYLHLYQDPSQDVSLEMDWDQPLLAFGGKTGFELAVNAYANFHLSQHRYEQFQVEPRDGRFSAYRFGLYYSAVGPDLLKHDMMENIPLTKAQED